MLPVPDPCDEHELFFEDVNSDAGFTLFLEALTSENVCTDVTATCSVRRAPSKHSMKANFQPKVFELVSEGSIAAEATAHDIAGDVSTELSSLPTAEEYRLKKLREKNRRTQQAYRNRQKVRHCRVPDPCSVLRECVASAVCTIPDMLCFPVHHEKLIIMSFVPSYLSMVCILLVSDSFAFFLP